MAFAGGLSLEVLAVPQAPSKDSPRARYGAGPPPYTGVEVAFQNPVDNVQLAGTLTVPRGALNAPAVLLSQGLGLEPFDRDYTLPNAPALKSFLAIADALSRNGISAKPRTPTSRTGSRSTEAVLIGLTAAAVRSP